MMLSASASQPLRRAVTMTTVEGKTVIATKQGGPDYSWWETADGQCYETVTGHANGLVERYLLKPVAAPAGTADKRIMRKAMNASTANGLGEYGTSGQGVVPSIGAPVIPVVMVAFSDLDFLTGDDETKVARFLNEPGYSDEPYAVGSVADYFRHSSYGAFIPQFEVVAKVTLPKDHLYYGAHSGSATDSHRIEAVTEAVRLAEEQGVDFSRFATDGRAPLISIFHAGPGEQEDFGADFGDYLWAHFSQTSITGKTTKFNSYLMSNETMRDFDTDGKLTGEKMTGIGTFCHEFGHALGLPDMYDVNGDRDGKGNTPNYWDVMDYQFMYDGYRPMEYSAYERAMMGWEHVVDLDASQGGQAFRLAPFATMAEGDNTAYRVVNPENANEYFIFENRQKSPFYQSNFLGHGMLVWHILYENSAWASNVVNTIADRQRVRVIPADGEWQETSMLNKKDGDGQRYTFPGDLFPGYTGSTLFDNAVCNFYEGDFDTRLEAICEDTDGVITFRYASDSDGVMAVKNEGHCAPRFYDLSGRDVKSLEWHGVYVSDGKKIVR